MHENITPQPAAHERRERALAPHEQNQKPGTSDHPGSIEIGSQHADGPNAQGIFDERFRLFTEAFGSTCEQEGVTAAVVIVNDPKIPNKPIVMIRGNEYAAAQLLAALLRRLQHDILNRISP